MRPSWRPIASLQQNLGQTSSAVCEQQETQFQPAHDEAERKPEYRTTQSHRFEPIWQGIALRHIRRGRGGAYPNPKRSRSLVTVLITETIRQSFRCHRRSNTIRKLQIGNREIGDKQSPSIRGNLNSWYTGGLSSLRLDLCVLLAPFW